MLLDLSDGSKCVVHNDNDEIGSAACCDNLVKEIRAEAVTARSLNLTDTDQVNHHQNLSKTCQVTY